MRLIVITNDVALQMGLSSLEPDLMVVHQGAGADGAPKEADVILIDLGTTARGVAVVTELRDADIEMPCVVIGESDTGSVGNAVPLLRPFTLDEVRDALLASGTPWVRAHGGMPPPAPTDEAVGPSDAKVSRKERKGRERAERAAAAASAAAAREAERERRAAEEKAARLEREQAEAAARSERERQARLHREETQRAEEAARLERERAERSAREERERAAEAARLQKAARAQRERAEQAAREAEAAARRELQRATEAAQREVEREEAARRELAALAGREISEPEHATSVASNDAPADEPESKRARKERQRAERALRDAAAAREERARAEAAAREEHERAAEAAAAATHAREERERVEQARAEQEEIGRLAREKREAAEAAVREERARLDRIAREEREAAEAAAREERTRAAEAARAERAAREARERAEAEANAEEQARIRAERASAADRARLEAEERERAQRVERARRAALARAEEMARREAQQTLARQQREAIAAREALRPRPEPRRPVSPPEAFVIPSATTGRPGRSAPSHDLVAPARAAHLSDAPDLVAPAPGRGRERRGLLSDLTGRASRGRAVTGAAAASSSTAAPSTADITKRVETALRAGSEIGSILEMLPGLGTPIATAEALLAEITEAFAPSSVAIYGRDGDLFSILSGAGLTAVERAGSVTAEHALFREVIEGSGVLIDPVDLARGVVAGIAGASANVLMAAPLWSEGRCHGVIVVGGEAFSDEALRALCAIAERGAPSLALSQLLEGLRSALT